MAPLASMLMLARVASFGRSRIALPAAAVLSRAARSGDLILGSNASKRQFFGCAQHTRRSFCTHSSSEGEENLYNEFLYEEKDMESDEALWALYHRWCKDHEVHRDHDDMVRRFDEFKCCVHEVHRVNNLGQDLRLSLNQYSDIPVSEMYSSTPICSEEAHARFKAIAKAVGGSFTMEYGPPAAGDDNDSPGWIVYYRTPDDD